MNASIRIDVPEPPPCRRLSWRALGPVLALVAAAAVAAPLVPLSLRLPPLPCDVAGSRPDTEAWLAGRCREALAARVPAGAELGTPHVRRTVSGWALRFPELRDGLPLQDALLVVSLKEDDDGSLQVRVAYDSLADLPETPLPAVEITPADAVRIARASLLECKPKPPSVITGASEPRLELDASGSIPAWVVVARGIAPAVDQRFVISALDGRVLDARDLIRHVTGRGRIFDPNPIVAAGDLTLRDQNDSAAAVPPGAYSDGVLLGLDPPVAGVHVLQGAHVSIEDLLPPADAPAAETDPAGFNYSRDDDHFEQVMVYHAVDDLMRHVQSLGMTDVPSRTIRADAHAQDAEGSYFTAADYTLNFGDGGVDDAEDADVIVHEACHAVIEDLVPGFAVTGDAGAIGEGIADFVTAARHPWSSAYPACIAAWDGSAFSTRTPPCSRRVDSLKHYPEDMTGDIHADGEIWAAALWDVRVRQGSSTIEQILLQSLTLLPPSPSLREASAALLQADADLGTGAQADICAAVVARGFVAGPSDCAGLTLDHVLVDDSIGGDGDGWLEPGEEADVLVGLRAGIGPTHHGTTMAVTSRDPANAAMTVSSASYADIAEDTAADPLAPPHRVRIAATAPCGARLLFDAAITSDEFVGTARFALELGEPVPVPPITGAFTGPPIDIPDNDPTGIVSAITLPGPLRVGAVSSVQVDIPHTYRGDLRVDLISPLTTTVRLHAGSGGGADDLITTYPTLSPVEGPGALADFRAELIAGDWLLHVIDVAGADIGQLRGWSITIDSTTPACGPGSTCTVQPIATGADGVLMVTKGAGGQIVLSHPGQATPCALGVQVRRAPTPRPSSGAGRWPLDPAFADVTGEDADPGPDFRHVPPPGLSCYLVVEVLPSGLPGPSGSYGR